jgi:hypothetical protein
MSFSRFELGFTRNRKVASLSDSAFRLWVSSIDYAREQKTDGMVYAPDLDVIPRCPPGARREQLIAELVQSGLWESADGGWRIHDFLDWQDSAVQVNERSKRARERMREIRSPRSREHHANSVDECSLEVLDGPSDPPSGIYPPSQASLDLPVSSGSAGGRGASAGPKKPRKAPMRSLPEPFEFLPEFAAHGRKKGWPEWWMRNRHEHFCDLALAKAWMYADWKLAFYTFCRGEIGYRRGPADLAHLAPKQGAVVSGQTPADRERARVEAQRAAQAAQDALELARTGQSPTHDLKTILEGIGGHG